MIKMKVLMNNELIDRKEAKVDIDDRGYQFGDGIYEVIRVYQSKMFTLKQHLDRLYHSAEKIDLTIPYSQAKLTTMLEELISVNHLATGTVYLQFSRGTQTPRNHIYKADLTANLVSYTTEKVRDPKEFRKGIATITVLDERWFHCDIKSLNLLGNLMATNQAAKSGAEEGIFYRSSEEVTECSHSNVSIIKDGILITHPADCLILNGITRQTILKVAKQHNIPVEERPFSLAELKTADEVFISSVSKEITAVAKVDDVVIGNGEIGPICEKLLTYYAEEIENDCGIKLKE